MKKTPFRLTPYQVQFLLIVGFVTVGYALYMRYLTIELSTVALACETAADGWNFPSDTVGWLGLPLSVACRAVGV